MIALAPAIQGIGVGAMVALIGASRSVFPLLCKFSEISLLQLDLLHISLYTVDSMYEHEQKRTYLSMLIQVGIYIPLLVGLVLLYPWLAGKHKFKFGEKDDSSDETEKLIPHDSNIEKSD